MRAGLSDLIGGCHARHQVWQDSRGFKGRLYAPSNGLKDPDTAVAQCTMPMITVEATMDAVKKAILDNME